MPFGAGNSPVTYATTKLSYPIFDAEFDPYDRGYLVVGGGGGENRTGVPNKLTLLDVSSHDAVTEVSETSLSTDEDSPQTIASLTSKQGLITFAGISSSSADQSAGKNEHLRSFDVEFPPKKRVKKDDEKAKAARITPAGKSQLFTPAPKTFKNPRAYQRLMRLSPVKSRDVATKRIGAIATADAAQHEIVLFDATTFLPKESSVLQRLGLEAEAEDLDLREPEEGTFSLAYCNNYEVYLYRLKCDFAKKSNTPITDEPVMLCSMKTSGKTRPKIRCLRWLSDDHLILLQNTQAAGSPELVILQIDPSSYKAKVTQRKKLPKSMGMGIRLTACALDADPATGERQIVLAVAGQNKSIHILTTNHEPSSEKKITTLQFFNVLDTSGQHPQSISKIAFSNFFPPRQPADSPSSVASETQYIQLASVSVGWTVSVETLALTSTPTRPALTNEDPVADKISNPSNRPSVRWVLSTRHSELLKSWFGVYVAAFAILVVSIMLSGSGSTLLSSFISALTASGDHNANNKAALAGLLSKFAEVESSLTAGGTVAPIITGSAAEAASSASSGASSASSGASGASTGLSSALEEAATTVSSWAATASDTIQHFSLSSLGEMLKQHGLDALPENPYGKAAKAIFLNAPGLSAAGEDAISEEPQSDARTDLEKEVSAQFHQSPASISDLRAKGAKRFEELSEHEKERWTRRLKEAGQWTKDSPVSVLKSVLFAEWADVVGGGLRAAIVG